jgi:hypothetical protein
MPPCLLSFISTWPKSVVSLASMRCIFGHVSSGKWLPSPWWSELGKSNVRVLPI